MVALRVQLCIWFVLLLDLVRSSPGISELSRRRHDSVCNDPLECKIENLVVPLPDFEADGFFFTDMYLKGMSIQGLPSSYIPETTLNVGVVDMGAQITGHYKYGTVLSGPLTGTVSKLDFATDVFVNETTTSTGFEIPNGVGFVPGSCSVSSITVKVTINVGFPHPAVNGVIENLIKKLVCPSIGDYLATNGTAAIINKVDPFLLNIMESKPSVPAAKYNSAPYINWSDVIIGPLHKFINMFTLSSLMNCFLDKHPDVMSPYLDSIIDGIVDEATNGTGIVYLNITSYNRSAHFHLPVGRNGSIDLIDAYIGGLDTFKDIAIIQPVVTSNASILTEFTLQRLDVNLTMIKSYGDSYNETFSVRIKLGEIKFGVEALVAVNGSAFDGLYLDQLLNPGCWLTSLKDISLDSLLLDIDVEDILLLQVHGDAGPLENDIAALTDNIFSLITDGFGPFFTEFLAGAVQGPVREMINSGISKGLTSVKDRLECPAHNDQTQDPLQFYDWANSSIVRAMDVVLNDKVGFKGINTMMNCATNNTGKFQANFTGVSIGGFSLPSFYLDVVGLNSLYDFSFLVPTTTGTGLSTNIGVGFCPSNITNPLDCPNPFGLILEMPGDADLTVLHRHLAIGSGLAGEGEGSIYDGLSRISRKLTQYGLSSIGIGGPKHQSIEIALTNAHLKMSTVAEIDTHKVQDLTVDQLGTNGCMGSTVADLEVNSLDITIGSGEIILDDGEEVKDVSSQLDSILPLVCADLPMVVNKAIASNLATSEDTCAHNGVAPVSNDDIAAQSLDPAWEWQLGNIVFACLVVLACFMNMHHYMHKLVKDGDKLVEEYEGSYSQLEDEQDVHEHLAKVNGMHVPEEERSVLTNPLIPAVIRYGMPLCIMGTFYLFLSSNLDEEAVTVQANVRVGGTVIPPIDAFSFSLKGTIDDMWSAGVYPLAILIAFFSAAWPYVKLAVMMAAWVLPNRMWAAENKAYYLQFVDAYGKYSLVDFYVMTLMLCAFHFDMQLAGDDLEVILYVVPNWGFLGFLLATLVSLGLGHISLAFLRFSQEPDNARVVIEAGRADTEFLADHPFKLKEATARRLSLWEACDSDSSKGVGQGHAAQTGTGQPQFVMSVTGRGRSFLLFCHLLLIAMIAYGSYAASFAFSFEGLTGWLLGDASSIEYSMVSVGAVVTTASGTPDGLGIRWMQACYFLFSLGMPIACLALSAVLWTGPALTLSHHRSCTVMLEVFYAWSALDVFCISVFAAITEISQFAAFMVGDKCDGINEILKAYMDPALHGDDVCFDVITTLCVQSPIIFLSAFLFVIVAVPSLSFCESALEDRILLAREGANAEEKHYSAVAYDGVLGVQATVAVAALEDKETRQVLVNPLLAASDSEIYSPGTSRENTINDDGIALEASNERANSNLYYNCKSSFSNCWLKFTDSILCELWRRDYIVISRTSTKRISVKHT